MTLDGGEWWRAFFDLEYAAFALDDQGGEAEQAVTDFLWSHMQLEPGQHVFDQCCGVGRVSLPLATRGVRRAYHRR